MKGMGNMMKQAQKLQSQMMKLQAHLREVPDLQVVSVAGSAAGDTKIIVASTKPLPLVSLLRLMPPVRGAAKKGNNIQVMLKSGKAA